MRRLPVVVTALAVLLAGGCGIPDNSDVKVIGPGPTSVTSVDDDGSPPVQQTRESTNDPVQFVDNYLRAAAGDPEGAQARVKAFMTDEFASGFKAGPDVKVVRMPVKPLYNPGDPEIKLTVRQVGVLAKNGALEPASEATATTTEYYKIRLTEVPGQGTFVASAPSVLLLTDDALNLFYQRRTIYFWNNEQTGLVPDMRYMPRIVPTVQQPTRILSWLASGPASWLSDQVQPLEEGTTAPDNVPAITDQTLRVTLSAQAAPPGDEKALDLLRRQLQWSLRPLLPRTLELQIGHQDPERYTDTDYLSSNAAYRLADTPERFVVFNGVIRRLANSPRATAPVPVLKPAENKGITAAAMSTSGTHTFVAVVSGSGSNQRLRVAAAPNDQQAGLRPVAGLSGTLGRPVWAIAGAGEAADAIGLITVGGRLYSFAADGSRARPVEWQGAPGSVTAVSVAPDGRRVALVAGGRLYRTVLGTGSDAVTLSTPKQVVAPTLSTVAAVAWSTEDWLTVAGVRSDGRVSIMDMSIDGALQGERLPDIGDKTVSYLTAYPANPVTGRDKSSSVAYTAGGQAWDALSTPVAINVADLSGTTSNPPAGMKPTAPFYLD